MTTTMRSALALALVLALAGCKKKEDEACSSNDDCADGLVCDEDGDETCQTRSTVKKREEKREEEEAEEEAAEARETLEDDLEEVEKKLAALEAKLKDAPDPKAVEEIAAEMKPLRKRRIELKKQLIDPE